MVDIAKLTIQIPVGMLSRYAAGRVNTHTVLVAEAMGMTFRMGKKGRANVEQAFSKLAAVSTLGNSLSIGFGIEDFTRDMVKSEPGAMLMGLCAALKDCYADDIAIEVMLEYARQTKAEGQYMPSNMEWRNLLDACAGSLAASNFALRAEHLMQLAKGERRPGADGVMTTTSEKRRGCSTPMSLADALIALAKLSNGLMESVSLTGGPDAGWLGAVAEWFLDLRIRIVDDQSREVLYSNHADNQDTQVTIVYLSQHMPGTGVSAPVNLAPGEPLSSRRDGPTGEVHIRDKTYKVSLEDLSKSLLGAERQVDAHVVSGRVPWSSALRQTFWSDFERLMTTRDALGAAIGSAAVLFSAMAQAHQGIPESWLSANLGYSDSSYGRGFIVWVAEQFPELSDLREVMEKAVRAPFIDAKRKYEASIARLTSSCQCDVRQRRQQALGHGHYVDNNDDGGDEHNERSLEHSERLPDGGQQGDKDNLDFNSNQYCSVIMAETIIRVCRYLSNVVIHAPDLQPMRSGFELCYKRCLHAWRSGSHSPQDLGQLVYCLDREEDFRIGVRVGFAEAVELKMYALLELYTGRAYCDTVERTSALWQNGISAFSSVLRPSHSETGGDVGQVHIVPGRISFEGKSYTHLVDRKTAATDDLTATGGSLVRHGYALGARNSFVQRLISIREGSTHLQCLMKFPREVESDSGSPALSVGPCALAAFLVTCKGLVHCDSSRTGKPCAPLANPPSKTYEAKGWVEYKHQEKLIIVMRPSSATQTLATLAFLTSSSSKCLTYIVDEQCNECCLWKAMNDFDRGQKFCFVYVS